MSKKRTKDLHLVEDELRSESELLPEPEPHPDTLVEEAAMTRIRYSNDWQRADFNAGLQRGIVRRQMERQSKKAEEIEKAINDAVTAYSKRMEDALVAISEIDSQCPEAKGKAKEMLAREREANKRIREKNLIRCPRCALEFAET